MKAKDDGESGLIRDRRIVPALAAPRRDDETDRILQHEGAADVKKCALPAR